MMGFLIIDDHPLFGEALGNAIRISHPDAQIFEAASIRQALNILATERNIDLALLDLLLPDAVGFSGFLRLRDSHPKLPILIVSSVEDKQTIREALAMGAVGYLSKSTSVSELSERDRPDFEWVGFRTKGVRGGRRHGANRSRPAREDQEADASTGSRAAPDQERPAEPRDCRGTQAGGVDREGSRDRDSAQTRTFQPQQGDYRNWEDRLAVAGSLPKRKGRTGKALLTQGG